MRRMDLLEKDVSKSSYRVFKGYSVIVKSRTESLDEHYVVPWEMTHKEWKKPVYH